MVEKSTYPFTIFTHDLDFTSKASLLTIGNLFMNVAGIDSHSKGFGIDQIHDKNLAWVSLRIRIKMNRYPELSEKVSIQTWVENWSRFVTQRNCSIYGENGENIGEIVSVFTLIDFKTRQTVNMQERLAEYEAFIIPEGVALGTPGKVKTLQNATLVGTHTVAYNDIDSNMHVNSFRYVAWVLDVIPLEVYKQNKIVDFEINFVHEVLYGETVSIYSEKLEENVAVFDIRNAEGVSMNRCKFTFEKR